VMPGTVIEPTGRLCTTRSPKTELESGSAPLSTSSKGHDSSIAALTHISCPDAISVANFWVACCTSSGVGLHRDYPTSGLQEVRRIRAVVRADIENNLHSVFLPRSGSRTSICRQSSDCRPG